MLILWSYDRKADESLAFVFIVSRFCRFSYHLFRLYEALVFLFDDPSYAVYIMD